MMKKTDWYFHFTTDNGHEIVWSWGREVSDKIYYTTWRPKAENIEIVTKGISPEDQQEIREAIIRDLKPELDHHIKKRVRR